MRPPALPIAAARNGPSNRHLNVYNAIKIRAIECNRHVNTVHVKAHACASPLLAQQAVGGDPAALSETSAWPVRQLAIRTGSG